MTKLKFPGSGCSGCNQNSFSDTLEIQDEGDSLGTASILDFVGEGVTATKIGGKATITINGGGGSFEIVDYTGIATLGLPTGVSAGYIAQVKLDPPYTPVLIGGVVYDHNTVIYKNAAGNWISWSANNGTQT